MHPLLWSPKSHRLGDVTLVCAGREYHLFSEMTPIAGAPRPPGAPASRGRVVGHAVSKDLFTWEELPPAISCGAPGEFDAFSIYHMDVFIHEGTWYMHYTGLDKYGPGEQEAIGLATSSDGIQWKKDPGNPVLRADPRFYEPAIPRQATYQQKDFGRLWFRDPCIVGNPPGAKFGMATIARDARQHPDLRGCIAWATSSDLVKWEPSPPIYSPGRFHTIETPSIIEHHGRHYLIFMTHPGWGTPFLTTDRYQNAGDFYAVSEHGPTGPWQQPADEIVVAAYNQMRLGAQRIIKGVDGEFYLYGWLLMTPSGDDDKPKIDVSLRMPPPRRVRFFDDGRMQVVYNPQIERFAKAAPAGDATPLDPKHWRDGGGTCGKHFTGRAIALLPNVHDNFIFSARVRFLRGHRAGLVARTDDKATTGWQIVADRRFGRIEFGTLGAEQFIDARSWAPRDEVELKVIAMGESVEVYADDRLLIHNVRYRETRGRIGYVVEHGEAVFNEPRLLELR
jgi:beta-fructofuranosidase